MFYRIVCVANCYSRCYMELLNSTSASLATDFFQLDWQFGHTASNFKYSLYQESQPKLVTSIKVPAIA